MTFSRAQPGLPISAARYPGLIAAALLAVSTIESLREARLSDAETGLPNRRALIRALPRQGTVVALRIANYN